MLNVIDVALVERTVAFHFRPWASMQKKGCYNIDVLRVSVAT